MSEKPYLERRPWEVHRMGVVVVDDLVEISGNNGLTLWNWVNFTAFAEMDRWREIAQITEDHYEIEPGKLIAALEKAIPYLGHTKIQDGLCSGWGRSEKGWITFERFLEILKRDRHALIARDVKREAMRIRRREFQAIRAQIILEMLDKGVPYECAHPGCTEVTNLTVDHKIALSRGGSDDISNLQFMCLSHNAQKNDGEA